MKKLPHPEESGDHCVHHIREFLINEMSSAECGVLPEDKLQQLVVGVCILCFVQQTLYKLEFAYLQPLIIRKPEFIFYYFSYNLQALNQLEIATHIERTALAMRLDSICTLKSALAGTATSKFTDVMEAVFGVDEEFAPELEKEELDEAEEEMPAEGVVTKGAEGDPELSTSKGVKCKASSSAASKHKQSKPTKAGVCLLEDATPYSLLTLRDICILGFPPNIFPNVRGANIHDLLSTSANMLKLSRLRVIMSPIVRSCVNKRHRSLVTSNNFISGIVLPAIYAITSGGLLLNGVNI